MFVYERTHVCCCQLYIMTLLSLAAINPWVELAAYKAPASTDEENGLRNEGTTPTRMNPNKETKTCVSGKGILLHLLNFTGLMGWSLGWLGRMHVCLSARPNELVVFLVAQNTAVWNHLNGFSFVMWPNGLLQRHKTHSYWATKTKNKSSWRCTWNDSTYMVQVLG